MGEYNKRNKIIIIVSSLGLILSLCLLFFLHHRQYEITVLDQYGYFTEFWSGVDEYEVKDSILYLNDGVIKYKMKPGETLIVNDYPR